MTARYSGPQPTGAARMTRELKKQQAEDRERLNRRTKCPVCKWDVYRDKPGGLIMDHGQDGVPCAGVELPGNGAPQLLADYL